MPEDSAKNNYFKPQPLDLRSDVDLDERWVQELIENDTSIIGLGDLDLKDRERVQPSAGRLDLLLQDFETKRRYEVEIQLGPTDEKHIIRTIEYWDIERKRYPQYDHCAVIIAEDITSRFFNVISLFNGNVPLIAIQMKAYKVGEYTTLIFTKVMDELNRGLVDEDEDALAAPTDRAYWEKKASKATVSLADQMLEFLKDLDDELEFNYNKFYIGMVRRTKPSNFVLFRPQKKLMRFELRLPKSEVIDRRIDESGLTSIAYDTRYKNYRLDLKKEDVSKQSELLRDLIKLAYKQ